MQLVENLAERKQIYSHFWSGQELGRPLVAIFARREHEARLKRPIPPLPDDPVERWLNPAYVISSGLATLANTVFLGDSIPNLHVDFGPGCLAAYLGCKPECGFETIWYHKLWANLPSDLPSLNEENCWRRRHLDLVCRVADIGRERGFYVPVPDLCEGLDILSSLRGGQELLLDLFDEPENVHRHLACLNKLYFQCYDEFLEMVKDEEGWIMSPYLETFGQGRTGKLQCDFAALLNPRLYSRFAIPYLQMQIDRMDYVAYHLDGPGALYSAPLLTTLPKLRVVQWVPGTGQPNAYEERWDESIFDPLITGGKVVQMLFGPRAGYSVDENLDYLKSIVAGVTRLMKKYGPGNFWLTFKYGFPESWVRRYLLPAARDWGLVHPG